jgi:hypothetical protein
MGPGIGEGPWERPQWPLDQSGPLALWGAFQKWLASQKQFDRVWPNVPKFVPNVPKFVPNVPKFVPNVPKFVPNVPKFVPNVPKFVPNVPKFVPMYLSPVLTHAILRWLRQAQL